MFVAALSLIGLVGVFLYASYYLLSLEEAFFLGLTTGICGSALGQVIASK